MGLVKFYTTLVNAGKITIDEVPIKYRAKVKEQVEAQS